MLPSNKSHLPPAPSLLGGGSQTHPQAISHLVHRPFATHQTAITDSVANNDSNNDNQDAGAVPKSEDWSGYSSYYSDQISRFTMMHAYDLVGEMLRDIENAEIVLDVACGAGAFGLAYLRWFPEGIEGQTLIMTDFSPGMVATAEKVMNKAIGPNFKTKIQYHVEDATMLEGIKDDSIDVVTSVFGVFLVPDHNKTMNTVKRVLRPGRGVFGTTAWTIFRELPPATGVSLHHLFDEFLKSTKGMTDEEILENIPYRLWSDPKAVRDIVGTKAGFQSVRIRHALHTVTFTTPYTVWDIMTKNPAASGGVDESDPIIQKAKKEFIEMLVVDGNDDTDAANVLTASNLIVAKGFE